MDVHLIGTKRLDLAGCLSDIHIVELSFELLPRNFVSDTCKMCYELCTEACCDYLDKSTSVRNPWPADLPNSSNELIAQVCKSTHSVAGLENDGTGKTLPCDGPFPWAGCDICLDETGETSYL